MMDAELLIAALEQRDVLSDDEKQAIRGAASRERKVPADADIAVEGQHLTESSLLIEGFAARYRILPNDGRQITSIHIPGDFVDLHSFVLKTMDHGVVALTDCNIAAYPHSALAKITERFPHLTRVLWLGTLIDASIHRQWLAMMGRSTASAQLAHLLCELFCRLRVVGHTNGSSFDFPVTQEELGDTLGLSTVHVNRVLKELREDRLITWHGRTIEILDWSRLQEVAEFDPTYLQLKREPR